MKEFSFTFSNLSKSSIHKIWFSSPLTVLPQERKSTSHAIVVSSPQTNKNFFKKFWNKLESKIKSISNKILFLQEQSSCMIFVPT